MAHETAHGYFPSGGWGWYWGGDPDCGFGPGQPGGWIYNILPHIEQTSLWRLGMGEDEEVKKAAAAKRMATPLSLLNCPSRRTSQPWDCSGSFTVYNAAPTPKAARTDYAACLGESSTGSFGGPPAGTDPTSDLDEFNWPNWQEERTGVMYLRSRVQSGHIRDGLGNTILVAEKYLDPDDYFTPGTMGDNRGMYQGDDYDNSRWTNESFRPKCDRPGVNSDYAFGSAHPSAMNVVFCDGSVDSIAYDIDISVFVHLGNRHDGNVVTR